MSSSALKLLAASGATDSATYVDDVFSNFRYKGNDNTNQIVNGIDLAGEGGLVWQKARSNYAANHLLTDTVRGRTKYLSSNLTSAEGTANDTHIASFNSDGFTLGSGFTAYENFSGITDGIMSWTFRKQPGFLDIVTYTGNGGTSQTINHNLGSVPGMIIVKSLTNTFDWQVYHRSKGNTHGGTLNESYAFADSATYWNDTSPTSAQFTVGNGNGVNYNNEPYVAYLFAHDAQDFGTDSDESIIKCGSYTGAGNGTSVTLGFEPQWLMVKKASGSASWYIWDNIRGVVTGTSATNGNDQYLLANGSNQEASQDLVQFNSTGFSFPTADGDTAASGETYIYMAIRRPFKPAEEFAATDLFNPTAVTQDGKPSAVTNFPVDLGILRNYGSNEVVYLTDRLRGPARLNTATNGAEVSGSAAFVFDYNNGYLETTWDTSSYSSWSWRRAPGFFDVVAYKGTGSAKTVTHNLGVAPEMIWVKARDRVAGWHVYAEPIGNNYKLTLDEDSARGVDSNWNNTTPNNSTFSIGTESVVNTNNKNYIAHLFATVAGISKVGSYTGTGNDLNVACGFSAGARFVMIKRSDATGDWYVWDTYRGIAAGNDPYLLMNDTAAQVTNTDYIDPLASGFTVTSSAPAALNASGGSYIFYAIA